MKTKKLYRFSRFFNACATVSILIILGGITGFFIKGINFGLEFKPGMMELVSIRAEKPLKADDVRNALAEVKGAEVKATSGGTQGEQFFQIKTALSNDAENAGNSDAIMRGLYTAYGMENVSKISTDFIGAQFSASLIKNTVLLVSGALVLIWLYALIRFRWDYALGAIIALLHDTFIILTFIIWSGMEFTTTTIAAILTIIGYSINATVVILDRLRENIHKFPEENFILILDKSLSETLSRSVITTVTTMFASISLFIFTTGSIHDFAGALNVGLLSGCFSSIFISSGFIAFVYKMRQKQLSA